MTHGFFNSTQTIFVNLGVPKSSPNRKGIVTEINTNFINPDTGERFKIAKVQFRDLYEYISIK